MRDYNYEFIAHFFPLYVKYHHRMKLTHTFRQYLFISLHFMTELPSTIARTLRTITFHQLDYT